MFRVGHMTEGHAETSLVVINGHRFVVPWTWRRTWRSEHHKPLVEWCARVKAEEWDRTGLTAPANVTLSTSNTESKEVVLKEVRDAPPYKWVVLEDR